MIRYKRLLQDQVCDQKCLEYKIGCGIRCEMGCGLQCWMGCMIEEGIGVLDWVWNDVQDWVQDFSIVYFYTHCSCFHIISAVLF